MDITIETLLSFSEKGQRRSNQDSIFWTDPQEGATYLNFVACDGVGGAKDGEVASQIAAEGFGKHLQGLHADEAAIGKALQHVQGDIDEYLQTHPDSRGMGTTLTLLQLHPRGLSIAHIGDSRVYHIRGGRILFCTEDHSLVVELKKQGLLAESERASRNVITRAIQGNTIKPTKADVHFSADLQTGDYFLLCTDGVWDCLPDEELLQLLAQELSDEAKVEIIRKRCAEESNDNYSLILLRICCSREDAAVTGSDLSQPIEEQWGTHIGVKVESTSKTPAATMSNETVQGPSAWRMPRWLARLLTK
ncbi:MAG: protein phosphatase 2C domain-containing protein [Saprospiraceae bacterium]|nr:protein phosphatase 2C domain-containing protein [Saprospiraceae bacterium]